MHVLTRRRTGADWWSAESHQPECVAVGGEEGAYQEEEEEEEGGHTRRGIPVPAVEPHS